MIFHGKRSFIQDLPKDRNIKMFQVSIFFLSCLNIVNIILKGILTLMNSNFKIIKTRITNITTDTINIYNVSSIVVINSLFKLKPLHVNSLNMYISIKIKNKNMYKKDDYMMVSAYRGCMSTKYFPDEE